MIVVCAPAGMFGRKNHVQQDRKLTPLSTPLEAGTSSKESMLEGVRAGARGRKE